MPATFQPPATTPTRMSTRRFDARHVVLGTLAGALSWVVGFLLTSLIVAPTLNDSTLNRVIEGLDGSLPTLDVVGWAFYNAHFVDVLVRGGPLGESAFSLVGGQNGFTPLLYAVPVALLLAAGLALARYQRVESPSQGALTGLTVLPGYLLLSVAGAFVVELTAFGLHVGPDLVMAALLAGLVYPVLFAGAGGAIGGFLEQRAAPGGD